MKTFCNPLSLPLKYQKLKMGGKFVFREIADPSVVLYKDKFILFASMTGGVYISEDLFDWSFYPTPQLPVCNYAPDVEVIGDYLYYCASNRFKPCTIYRTKDIFCQTWEKVSTPFSFWDPTIFCDDDGRVYFYWGCGSGTPIMGVELDNKKFLPISQKIPVIKMNSELKGFEVNGENNVHQKPPLFLRLLGMTKPFIEGAWMNKINGKYYLQYGNPGTEYNVYNDAVYVSNSPLGEFNLQKHNPFSMKPGGFINGAGHGSTFQDKFGNLWHIASMRISINNNFERRLGLFPAGVDSEGNLYCNTRFADYPKKLVKSKMTSPYDCDLPWNLLSYRAHPKGTSELKGFEAKNAIDEDIRTCWMPKDNDDKKELIIELKQSSIIHAIQISIADRNILPPNKKYEYQGSIFQERELLDMPVPHHIVLFGQKPNTDWEKIIEGDTYCPEYSHTFDVPHQYQTLKLSVKGGSYNAPVAISGFRIFGIGQGEKPNHTTLDVKRTSPNSMHLEWDFVTNATGYEIHWGISPDKLYLSWLVYNQNELDINSLIAGQDYYVSITVFNENGVEDDSNDVVILCNC